MGDAHLATQSRVRQGDYDVPAGEELWGLFLVIALNRLRAEEKFQRADKRVHFEFLDNSVAFGVKPRTAAFGWNDTLNVLDVKSLLDIDRYRRVNIDATSAETLYGDPLHLAPEHNAAFLRECVKRFSEVNFADASTGRIYARIARGAPVWADAEALRDADAESRSALAAIAPNLFDRPPLSPSRPTFVGASEKIHTLGTWNGLS